MWLANRTEVSLVIRRLKRSVAARVERLVVRSMRSELRPVHDRLDEFDRELRSLSATLVHDVTALTEARLEERRSHATELDVIRRTCAELSAARLSDQQRHVEEVAALAEERGRLEQRVDVLSGLNLLSFREEIAYRGFSDDAVFINVGAGGFSHPRWTNVDMSSAHYDPHRASEFIEHDLNSELPLPFASGSVALAYTSHTIEHVKDAPAASLFQELHRVLRPGGVLRITCPDAAGYYRAARHGHLDRYFYRMNTWFRRHGVSDDEVAAVDFIARGVATGLSPAALLRDTDPDLADELTAAFEALDRDDFLELLCGLVQFSNEYVDRHVNWWTHDKVHRMLNRAGFDSVWTSTFGGSIAAPMCDTTRFDTTVRDESLYVEALR